MEILTFDNESLLEKNNYKDRLYKVQIELSNNRYSKFTSLNSDNFDEFLSLVENSPNEKLSSFFILNYESLKNNKIDSNKIYNCLLENSKLISMIFITKPTKDHEIEFKALNKKYKLITKTNQLIILINKEISKNDNDKILDIYNANKSKNYLNLLICYVGVFIYKKLSLFVKKIYYTIFKFRF